MKSITKRIFLHSRECLTRGWFLRRPDRFPEPPPSPGLQFRLDQGTEIGELARQLFAGPVMEPGGSNHEAAQRTRQLLNDLTVEVLFEGSFISGDCVTRPDILIRGDGGWHVIEVKSNAEPNPTKLDDLQDDLTYTVTVLRQAGLSVLTASLLVLARNYRKGMPIDRLFVKVDCTEEVNRRVNTFLQEWNDIAQATGADDRPQARLCSACRTCPHFNTSCIGAGVEHPVTTLHSVRAAGLEKLVAAGVMSIRDIPANFELTALQQRMVDCVRNGRQFVSTELAQMLAAVAWPAFYLDFETVATALPLFDNVAPWEQVTTQFSVHRCAAPGQIDSHAEFLAEPQRDCRRELTERLLDVLGQNGSIIVYHDFEQKQIKALARAMPDLADRLTALLPRLVDLCSVIRDGYYDPGFAGSFSLKQVLPVLVTELNYDGVAIADGETASVCFAKMARGQLPPEEAEQAKQNLLDYCRQDTLAMVRLHQALAQLTQHQLE